MSFTPNPSAILKNKKSNLNNNEAYQKINLQIFLEQAYNNGDKRLQKNILIQLLSSASLQRDNNKEYSFLSTQIFISLS